MKTLQKWKILVVDDEPSILQVLRLRLESAHYEVETARDGVEALDKVREMAFDLIILDLMMPRRDGYELCHLLKQDSKYHEVPVLILSAKSQDADKQDAFEMGADAYLTKPYSNEELLRKVGELIAKSKRLT